MAKAIRGNRRWIGRLGVVSAGVGLFLGAVLVAPTPAMAASDASAYCGVTNTTGGGSLSCGWAYFTAEVGDGSEELLLEDDNADGYSAVVENYRWDLANPGPYYGYVNGGLHDSHTWTLHIPEGKQISFRVCAGHAGYTDSQLVHCGAWVAGTA